MRGDAMTNFDSNPYSPPTDEPHAKPGATHYEFQVTARGIRCRTGLQLPKICLLTGRADDLMPYPVHLKWLPLFSRVILWCALLFFLIGISDILERFREMEWLRIAWSSFFYDCDCWGDSDDSKWRHYDICFGCSLSTSSETKLDSSNRSNRRCWSRQRSEPVGSSGSIGNESNGHFDRCFRHGGTLRVRLALDLQQEITDRFDGNEAQSCQLPIRPI